MLPLPDGRNFDILIRSEGGKTKTYRTQSILSSVGSRNRLGKALKYGRQYDLKMGKE